MLLANRIRALRESVTGWNRGRIRKKLGRRFLRGTGIEIGALHRPYEVAEGVEVLYLDRLSTQRLRREYPELAHEPIVEVDIVEDAENPRSIESESFDFVIASHVIEHCEDPIGALKQWLRIIRPGGTILLVVPDRRRTFDRGRPATTVEHLLADHRDGPERSRLQHYREWVRIFPGETGDEEADARTLMTAGYRPHFHVWAPAEFEQAIVQVAAAESLPLEVAGSARNYREFLLVVEKT